MEEASTYGSIFGFSHQHYYLVENVRHLSTGFISPWFHLFYNEIVFNPIYNNLFELNRDWYSEYNHDDTGKLIYQYLLYKTSWLMGKKVVVAGINWRISVRIDMIVLARRIAKSLILLLFIQRITRPGVLRTPLYLTKVKCWFFGGTFTYIIGGIFVSDNFDGGSPDYTYRDSNIPSPSQPSHPNTPQEGDIYQERYQFYPKRKYQHKQWPESVWERASEGKLKCVKLNKRSSNLYAITFGPQTIPPMAQKNVKKRMCLNYKKYKCSLSDNGDVSMHRMAVCDKILTASELMASTLVQYITIASNNCGYVGTLELLIINYVHP